MSQSSQSKKRGPLSDGEEETAGKRRDQIQHLSWVTITNNKNLQQNQDYPVGALQKFLTQPSLLSLNRASRFFQNDNDLTTVMNIKFWIYKKIVRWHFTNIYQRSSRSLQKTLEDWKMKAKYNLPFSYCPTALVCCPPSFLPFLTGSCQLSGLIEKNDKKDWNLTTLTEN